MQIHTHQESSLGELLIILRKNMVESMKKEGFKHDLTFSQMEVLRYIGGGGKKTMREIADHLNITPPSTTEIARELEKKSLVKRIGDTEDRRIVNIVLTKSAQELYASSLKKKNYLFKKMISKLNTEDRKNFERIIRILIKE